MPKIERFEDLEAWKRARELAQAVYGVTRTPGIARDYPLRDQFLRAAVSVISNIAEGFERVGDRELRHFLSIAKGSTGELRAQLYFVLDAQLLPVTEVGRVMDLASSTGQLIGGLIRYLDGCHES